MTRHDELEPLRYTGYLIRRAQQAHLAAWMRLVSTETSSVQYTILVALERMGELSQRELCDQVDLDRSTIADMVSRMERRGLIERRRDPADARRNHVTLTAQGLHERERLKPLVAEVERELTGALTDAERDALRHGLQRLLAAK